MEPIAGYLFERYRTDDNFAVKGTLLSLCRGDVLEYFEVPESCTEISVSIFLKPRKDAVKIVWRRGEVRAIGIPQIFTSFIDEEVQRLMGEWETNALWAKIYYWE